MPGYPTSVSRKAASYSQSAAGRPSGYGSASAGRLSPAAQRLANAGAQKLAREALPVTARGAAFVMPWLGLLLAGYGGYRLWETLSEIFSTGSLAGTTLVCGSASGDWIGHMGPCPPQTGFSWSNPDWDARHNNWASAVADGLGLRYVTNVDYQPGNAVFADDVGQATIDNPNAGGLPEAFQLPRYPAFPGMPNLQHVMPEWAHLMVQSAPGADIADNMSNSPFEQGYKIGPEARDVYALQISPDFGFQKVSEETVFDLIDWLKGGKDGPPPGKRLVPGPTWDFDPKRRELEGDGSRPLYLDPHYQHWGDGGDPETQDWYPAPWEFNPYRLEPGWYFDGRMYWDGRAAHWYQWPYGISPEIFYGPGPGDLATGVRPPSYEEAPNVRFDTGPRPDGGGAITRPPYLNMSYDDPDAKGRTSLHPRWVATRMYSAFTEFGDFTNAVFKAVPKKHRPPVKGGYTIQAKWEVIGKSWAVDLDWSQALRNIYEDQVEDFYYGQIGRAGARAQQQLFKNKIGPSSGPTLTTRLTKLGAGRLPNFSLPQL